MVREKKESGSSLNIVFSTIPSRMWKRQEVQIPSNEEISEVNLLNESKLNLDKVNEYTIEVELNPLDMTYKGKQKYPI